MIAVPIIFFLMAVSLIAQASIVIQGYKNKVHDFYYLYSCTVLSIAIIGLLISFYMIYKESSVPPLAPNVLPNKQEVLLKALGELK